MIINARRTAATLGITLGVAACARSPGTPPGYQGILELDERVLAFEVPGRVDTVAVRRGDVVKDGQPLAKLDDALELHTRRARAAEVTAASAEVALLEAGPRAQDVAAALSELDAATSSEALARKNAERVRSLHDASAVSQAELDRATADVDRAAATRRTSAERLSALRAGSRRQEIARARARLEAAQSMLALEDARLEQHALRARGDGLVLDVHLEPGEIAGVGTPAISVADVAHPYAEVFVPVGELAGVRVGTKADVRVDAAPAPFAGAVEHVAPRTEFTPRFLFSERERPNLVLRVRVRVDDPERRLHAGVPTFVQFRTGS